MFFLYVELSLKMPTIDATKENKALLRLNCPILDKIL